MPRFRRRRKCSSGEFGRRPTPIIADHNHKTFAQIGFSAQDAADVSFIELLHVPTYGRSRLDRNDLDKVGSLTSQAVHIEHTVVPADSVQWGPAPSSLPLGAQAAALLGNPAKEGPFVLRLKFPAGFVVPPHRHSTDEFVTVISGKFSITSGEKVDRASMQTLPAGSFVHLPAGIPHYAWAEVESVVQINGTGPFDVGYVNPGDDPRKQ